MGPTEAAFSDSDASRILGLLRSRHNVLVSGPPACGKSLLLSQVSAAFSQTRGPAYRPDSRIPLPAESMQSASWLPSPEKSNRKVFRTVFNQGTKQTDFLRGLIPVVSQDYASIGISFRVSKGVFFEAAQFALGADHTALLVIDEINRGPAVAVFGASIVSIESDKRLGNDNRPTPNTQTFRLLDDNGDEIDYALSPHLYILAAMNQADTSIEPLDVAFLRRFASYPIFPKLQPLLEHFSMDEPQLHQCSTVDETAAGVYCALIKAWQNVNRNIALARGDHYQIGHGVLMSAEPPTTPLDAAKHANQAWRQIFQHVQEVFFGDDVMIAAVIGADTPGSFYELRQTSFAGQPISRLNERLASSVRDVQQLLLAVASSATP